TVLDSSGAAVGQAIVTLHNSVTGYSQNMQSANNGTFHFTNVPPNTYHLEIKAPGFAQYSQEVTVRSSLPIQVKATLAVATSTTTVNVEAASEALETDPSAHADVDRNQMLKLPGSDPGAGLSNVILYTT